MPKTKKKPAEEPAAEPAAAISLDSLAKKLGPPDAELGARTFRHAREAELVEAGTAVDSANVLEDVPRFVASAVAIRAGLSPSQQKLVRFPQGLLPVLVHEATQLRDLKTKHDAQKSGDAAGKARREADARQAMRDAIAERDTVYDSLRNALGPDCVPELNSLAGTAETGEKLASGLEALAGFIERTAKAGGQDALALQDYDAGPERAVEMRALAKAVRELAQATAGSRRRVTQRALDLQDGRVLMLIGQVLRAFRAARRADSAILLPELNRLTRLYDIRPRGKGAATEPAAPPEPQAPA